MVTQCFIQDNNNNFTNSVFIVVGGGGDLCTHLKSVPAWESEYCQSSMERCTKIPVALNNQLNNLKYILKSWLGGLCFSCWYLYNVYIKWEWIDVNVFLNYYYVFFLNI